MKKVLTYFLSFLMIFSMLTLIAGCANNQKVSDSVIETMMGACQSGADLYVDSVKDASPEEVESLKEDGQNLLKSLDELDAEMDKDSDDLSEETRNNIKEQVVQLRDKVNGALAELETK